MMNGASCHIGASNPIPVLLPRSWGSGSYEMGKAEHGHEGAPEDGSVSRSVPVLTSAGGLGAAHLRLRQVMQVQFAVAYPLGGGDYLGMAVQAQIQLPQ